MAITVAREMNPIFETICLCFNYYNKDVLKERMGAELDELGFDGADIVREKLGYLDKYLAAFGRKWQPHPADEFFFQDMESQFCVFPTLVLMEHPEYLENLAAQSQAELRQALGEMFTLDGEFVVDNEIEINDLGSLENCVDFINNLHCGADLKWQFMLIFENPHHWLGQLITIYQDNLPAYTEAAREMYALLGAKFAAYPEQLNANYLEILTKLSPNATIYPSLASPLTEYMGVSISIYGLFSSELPLWRDSVAKDKEDLLVVLKTISDKSKFAILCSLKNSPKYNLEIAEDVGLTPATTSHHMNMLLGCGLVSVEKEGGKVYYHLSYTELASVIEHLKKYLLAT